ncbi:unnamed protein product [Schistosoma curassoni]|uniref:Uncharacterized protein n=1 Tax=Schistosoma curassoni TaxID=6186 RepID=A0A183KCM7_9TREM|nr:unnamed protein product [Schistosoma curassoni]
MRLEAQEVRTRISSHVPNAEFAYPYAFATNRIINNRYGVGLFLYYMNATPFLLFRFFCILGPRPRPSPVCYRRLQSTLAKAGLITHALVNTLSRNSGYQSV